MRAEGKGKIWQLLSTIYGPEELSAIVALHCVARINNFKGLGSFHYRVLQDGLSIRLFVSIFRANHEENVLSALAKNYYVDSDDC